MCVSDWTYYACRGIWCTNGWRRVASYYYARRRFACARRRRQNRDKIIETETKRDNNKTMFTTRPGPDSAADETDRVPGRKIKKRRVALFQWRDLVSAARVSFESPLSQRRYRLVANSPSSRSFDRCDFSHSLVGFPNDARAPTHDVTIYIYILSSALGYV